MRRAFADNPDRVEQLSRTLDGMFVDMSKQKWDLQVLESLLDLAREADMEGAIGDLFGGVKLNATEGRAVLHMALRADQGDVFTVDGEDVVGGVLDVRERMLRLWIARMPRAVKAPSQMWSTLAWGSIWAPPWLSRRCVARKDRSVTSSAMWMALV